MKKRGFTIIELLVVVLIISILASIGAYEYISHLRKSRDTVRKADLRAIAISLDIYRTNQANPNYQTYPHTGTLVATAIAGTAANIKELKNTSTTDSAEPNFFGEFSGIKNDPLSGKYYSYTTNAGGTEYKLSAQLESDTNAMTSDGGNSPDYYEIFSKGGNDLNIPSSP